MSKSFNPTQTLICHLCGQHYTEERGHSYEACEARLLTRVAEIRKDLISTERKREEASFLRQRGVNRRVNLLLFQSTSGETKDN